MTKYNLFFNTSAYADGQHEPNQHLIDEMNEQYWELMEMHDNYHTEEVDRRYAEYEEDETVSDAPGDPEGCIPSWPIIGKNYPALEDHLEKEWFSIMMNTNDNTVWC